MTAWSSGIDRALQSKFVVPATLFFGTLALYLPSLWNGFVYDDFVLIVDQIRPRAFGDLFTVFWKRHSDILPYYRPVPWFTILVQKFLHDNAAGWYHFFNATAAALGAVAAHRLLSLPRFGIRPAFAALGAALFAAHPIASEVVYPASSGRESLLPALFVILSLEGYLRSGRNWRFVSWLAFAAALFSKEQAVVAPVLFLLADWAGLRETPEGSKGGNAVAAFVLRYLPYAVVFVGYFVLRQLILGGVIETKVALMQRPWGPVQSVAYAYQSLFVPFAQHFYEPRLEIWLSDWRLSLALGAGVLIPVGAWAAGQGRVLARRMVFFHAWFLLALAPTANILAQEAKFAERFVFLSSLALIAALGLLASHLDEVSRRYAAGVGALALMASAALTVGRCGYYRDNFAFLTQWASGDARATNALASLGEAHWRNKDYDQAIEWYRKALAVSARGVTYTSLGNALSAKGDHDAAIAAYRQALRVEPGYAKAREALALALAAKGVRGEALAEYERALQANPEDPGTLINYANALQDEGRVDEAISYYERSIRLSPYIPQTHYNLGRALTRQNRNAEAMAAYRKAIEYKSDYGYAHYNLALLLQQAGGGDEMIRHFDAAFAADPKLSAGGMNAGDALMKKGEPAQAAERFRKVAEARPSDPKPLLALGAAYEAMGERGKAHEAYEAALKLDSSQERAREALGRLR